MADAKRKGLGKGLGALIGGGSPLNRPATAPTPTATVAPAPAEPVALSDGAVLIEVDPSELRSNPKQPRHVFREEALQELAESIRRDGVQEPVLVRRVGEHYELISGERRVRASIMADRKLIPAVVRDVSDRDMLKLGIIENIQREDLNAMETAQAYQDLMDEFGWTQEQVSQEVGKKRATVANSLRLLNLPEPVQVMVADGSLSMGHARALLSIESVSGQINAARKIVNEGLSVRQAEKLATEQKGAAKPPALKPPKDPNVAQLEDDLRRRLGTKVHLKTQEGGKGRIEIEYFSLDELDRLLGMLRG
ncbi:MAG: ParB/RepB/Spo0J family partition protein [Candidatus Hydrogenedentes bacterium]|nr:ParB/RepB/Spo0J family partition protein [Candidatus Hydrogenedentota bacterium]